MPVELTERRFAGCLIGQCLGDALGFPVEGAPPQACRRYVEGLSRSGDGVDITRHGYQFGQYTDDSQLARELLQTYAARGELDLEDYAARIAAIFTQDRIVGRGLATEEAAFRLASGVPWEEAGALPPSAGNGSAMRAGPVGLLFFDDPDGMARAAHDQGRITHQDRRCSAGAVAIAGGVSLALKEGPFDLDGFVSALAEWTGPFDPILADALGQMPEWVGLAPEEAVLHISRVGLEPGYSDGWQAISPFVTTSVLWSLYSFLRAPDDYWEAIITAITVGGDVDTTAAMTGAISGSRVGLEGVPLVLAKRLTDRGTWGYDELVELAARCYSIRMSG
jgi:ADP-ribosylglycohydrolase